MKILYNLLLILIFGFSASAQCRLDTLYQYEFIPGTLVKEPTYRNIYTYDVNNNETQLLYQTWDAATSTYLNSYKYNKTYDAANNEQENIVQTWHTSSNSWVNANKTNYTYNVANLITSFLQQTWNTGSNSWVPGTRGDFVYNTANKPTEQENSSWIVATSLWRIDNKSYLTYDVNNNLLERLAQSHNYSTNTLDNFVKYNYIYNVSNQKSEEQIRFWDAGVWDFERRTNFTYNISNQLIESISQVFYTPTWYNSNKYTYNYTTFDSISVEQNYEWNHTTNVWDNSIRWLYSYDTNNSLTERKTETYDDATSAWTNNRNEIYEYNNDNAQIAVDYYQDWLPGSAYYNTHTRQEFKCTQNHLGMEETTDIQSLLRVYPNPVTEDRLYIDSKASQPFSIINLNGQTIMNGTMKEGQNPIDLTNVASGLYIIKVGSETMKITIQ